MKTQNIVLSILIILLLFFAACREVTVTTKVNADGSFMRIITVTGDSSDVIKTDLPFPVDDSWIRTASKDTSDSTKYVVTYTKSFKNSKVLMENSKKDTSSYSDLSKEISIMKKFRFFFSYLTFHEVYKSANPFNNLDYHQYLTEEDLRWCNGMKIPITPADSVHQKNAEDKVLAFLLASAVSEIESIMKEGIRKLNNPALNVEDISRYHDSLYSRMGAFNLKEGSDFSRSYREWSGNEAYSLLDSLQPPIFQNFTKKIDTLETIFALEGYTEEVEMPGLITATNSAMLKGNSVQWNFQPLSVAATDYEMFAESRVINYWAFVLAGCVLLALVVLLAVKAVRK